MPKRTLVNVNPPFISKRNTIQANLTGFRPISLGQGQFGQTQANLTGFRQMSPDTGESHQVQCSGKSHWTQANLLVFMGSGQSDWIHVTPLRLNGPFCNEHSKSEF